MKTSQFFGKGRTVFAVEVFPPNKNVSTEKVYTALEEIAQLSPDYISVTCGAGGNSVGGNPTLEVSSFIKNKCNIESVAHLTCVCSSKSEVVDTLHALKSHNIGNVLALRGDVNPEIPRKNDFMYAVNLIEFIRKNPDFPEFREFGISGACYPEGHTESECVNADLKNLKNKVDGGCDTLITQIFFDNAFYYSFLDKARLIGIDVPISAGIMPVTNKKQIERMVSMCGASLPPKFTKMIAKYESRPDALRDAGIAYATEQIVELISNGVEGIHLYAMNSPYVAKKIHESIVNIL